MSCFKEDAMRNFRLSLITFFISITLLFNVERLGVNSAKPINLDGVAYMVAFIAVAATIVFPALAKINNSALLGFWSIIYILSKVAYEVIGLGHSWSTAVYPYIFITELCLILICIYFAHKASRVLIEFEEAVEVVTFESKNRQIRHLDEAQDEIQTEMYRSRNYQRALSLIVIKPDPEMVKINLHQIVQEAQKSMISNYMVNNMAKILSHYLRRTDLVFEQRENGQLVIFCPETTAKEVPSLIEHIQTITKEKIGFPIMFGAATFPEDAVTFEELKAQAESKLGLLISDKIA
jgi:hypothetical protein